MLRYISIIFFILFFNHFVFGQNDHLIPPKQINSELEILKKYYNGLFSILYRNLSVKPVGRYTVLPSFSSEFVLSAEKDSTNKCKLIIQSCSESYWYANKRKKVKIYRREKAVTPDLINSIQKLFYQFINQIKESESSVMGLDGTTYCFSTYKESVGLVTGETWSPEENSKMSKLVNICDQLVMYTNNKDSITETIIIENINNLVNEN